MKHFYIVILIIFVSCNKNKKENKIHTIKVSDSVKVEEQEELVPVSLEDKTFLKEINKASIRVLPITEKTNFDSFIEAEDYKDVNVNALKLLDLYPDFYKETHNFRAIASYRIKISESFYSMVITVKKGDNEMESRLINYNLEGNIIDSKIVAYDEIAEGMSMINSKIEQDLITIDHILWIDEKEVKTKYFKINKTGKIEPLNT